jgi:hypothetical protein
MSKLIYICTRNTKDCSRLVKAITSTCAAISPDNITPRSAKIVENGGIAFGLTNPSVTVRINGQSIVLGHTDDSSDSWSIAGSEVPDGNFAIFRADKDSVELISDIVGSRTIWYYKDERIFIASTSQRAIVLILGSYQFDDRVIPWMLSTGMLGPSFSWDRRVTCVPVDSLIRLSRSNWTLTTSSKPINFSCTDLSDSRHEELLENALEESFGALNIDVFAWVLPLSGGYDSRAILCYLLKKRALEKKLRCVTWGLGSSLAEKGNDAYVAKALASRLNVPHTFYHTDMSVDSAKGIVDRFILNGEGRIDHLAGYMDSFQIWKTLFEDGVHGVIRGDEGFGWGPVASPHAVLSSIGIDLCSNFSNLRNCEAFELPDQRIPSHLQRRSAESLSTWRDRLYQEYRIPAILAALSDLKLSYVEQMNPLLSRKILTVLRCLPDHLRTNKSLFKRVVAKIGPKVEIANVGANASPENILRQRRVVEVLRSEIDSERARSLVPSGLIMKVVQNLQIIDGPATRRHSFRSKFKELVPSFARDFLRGKGRDFLREKGVVQSLDFNVLAFRIYLISQMNAVLSADAYRAGGNLLTISGPSVGASVAETPIAGGLLEQPISCG